MHRFIIAITGTPGTGKSHFANRLKTRGVSIIEINDLVHRHGLYSGKDKFNTKIVRLNELNKFVRKEIGKVKGSVVLVGHLAPELAVKYDVAVCMRAGLETIAKRMEKRHYPKEKIRENLVSEAMNYCGSKIKKKCREVYEAETVSEKNAAKKYILALIKGRKIDGPRKREINKFPDLMKMIKKGNKYGL